MNEGYFKLYPTLTELEQRKDILKKQAEPLMEEYKKLQAHLILIDKELKMINDMIAIMNGEIRQNED